jgi:hypothetical protein
MFMVVGISWYLVYITHSDLSNAPHPRKAYLREGRTTVRNDVGLTTDERQTDLLTEPDCTLSSVTSSSELSAVRLKSKRVYTVD